MVRTRRWRCVLAGLPAGFGAGRHRPARVYGLLVAASSFQVRFDRLEPFLQVADLFAQVFAFSRRRVVKCRSGLVRDLEQLAKALLRLLPVCAACTAWCSCSSVGSSSNDSADQEPSGLR
jgi:hypothetical protein